MDTNNTTVQPQAKASEVDDRDGSGLSVWHQGHLGQLQNFSKVEAHSTAATPRPWQRLEEVPMGAGPPWE